MTLLIICRGSEPDGAQTGGLAWEASQASHLMSRTSLARNQSMASVRHGGAGLDAALADAMSALPNALSIHDAPTMLLTSPRYQDTLTQGYVPGHSPSTVSATVASLGAAGSLAALTAEPVLDDAFLQLVRAHFDDLAESQTQRLQKRLNAGLPVILKSMGVSPDALCTR